MDMNRHTHTEDNISVKSEMLILSMMVQVTYIAVPAILEASYLGQQSANFLSKSPGKQICFAFADSFVAVIKLPTGQKNIHRQ